MEVRSDADEINLDLNAIKELDLTPNRIYFGSYKCQITRIVMNGNEIHFENVPPNIRSSQSSSSSGSTTDFKFNLRVPFSDIKTLSLCLNENKIYMIFDLIAEAVFKIQTLLVINDIQSLQRYTGKSNDLCARYISLISDGDEDDIERIENLVYNGVKIVKISSFNALKIIELSENPIQYNVFRVIDSESKTPPVLRSSLFKDSNYNNAPGFSNKRSESRKINQETHYDHNYTTNLTTLEDHILQPSLETNPSTFEDSFVNKGLIEKYADNHEFISEDSSHQEMKEIFNLESNHEIVGSFNDLLDSNEINLSPFNVDFGSFRCLPEKFILNKNGVYFENVYPQNNTGYEIHISFIHEFIQYIALAYSNNKICIIIELVPEVAVKIKTVLELLYSEFSDHMHRIIDDSPRFLSVTYAGYENDIQKIEKLLNNKVKIVNISSSEALGIINSIKKFYKIQDNSVLENSESDSNIKLIEENIAMDSISQEVNHEPQSTINFGINEGIIINQIPDKAEYIKILSLTIKGIHENWIKNGSKKLE